MPLLILATAWIERFNRLDCTIQPSELHNSTAWIGQLNRLDWRIQQVEPDTYPSEARGAAAVPRNLLLLGKDEADGAGRRDADARVGEQARGFVAAEDLDDIVIGAGHEQEPPVGREGKVARMASHRLVGDAA